MNQSSETTVDQYEDLYLFMDDIPKIMSTYAFLQKHAYTNTWAGWIMQL